jgi:hypothetical protein
VTELRLHIVGFADSDQEERAELAFGLERELLELDIEDISRSSPEPPSGAKGTTFEWAELIVSAGTALAPLVAVARSWLGRHPKASITLTIDGDTLALTDATEDERSELIAAWMARHGG